MQPRGSVDRRALLRLLLAELAQELRKSHPAEAKRLQLLDQPDLALGRREAADYGADPEEQRVGECPGGQHGPRGQKRVQAMWTLKCTE